MMRNVLCVHLLDDYSGAAKVFAAAIAVLRDAGCEVRVIVGSEGASGFIRDAHPASTFPYTFSNSKFQLLINFLRAQWHLFWGILKLVHAAPTDVIYVNALMPAAAVLAGFLTRRKVVVHLHEVGMGSAVLFRALYWITSTFSDEMIVVSNYMIGALGLPSSRTRRIYNSMTEWEWQQATKIFCLRAQTRISRPRQILMACSLKWYKGIDSFLDLAAACARSSDSQLAQLQWKLVLNSDLSALVGFGVDPTSHPHVQFVFRPSSIYDHYAQADLVVNFSHPDGWIETFGLTLLEAMACGIPVVGPVVGGCTELFTQGEGGWQIDSRERQSMMSLFAHLFESDSVWQESSNQARLAAERFSPENFRSSLLRVFL